MNFVVGPYIKRDIKKIKINSIEEDIESHYKIFRGKVTEIKSQYSVPLAQAFLYETTVDDIIVYFYKDRCATKNPKNSPASGLRIVFGLFVVDGKPIKYMPFLVFLAKDEGNFYLAPNNKKYRLTSSNFKHIIEAKLTYLS